MKFPDIFVDFCDITAASLNNGKTSVLSWQIILPKVLWLFSFSRTLFSWVSWPCITWLVSLNDLMSLNTSMLNYLIFLPSLMILLRAHWIKIFEKEHPPLKCDDICPSKNCLFTESRSQMKNVFKLTFIVIQARIMMNFKISAKLWYTS